MKLTIFGYGFKGEHSNTKRDILLEPSDTLFIDNKIDVHHIALRDGGLTLALEQPIETVRIDADQAPGATHYWVKPVEWADLPTVLTPLAADSAANCAEPPPLDIPFDGLFVSDYDPTPEDWDALDRADYATFMLSDEGIGASR